MNTTWRSVVGYEGLYSVSSTGLVRRDLDGKGTHAGKILKPGISQYGYYKVVLSRSGKTQTTLVHRLVSQAFLGDPGTMTVNHIDGNKLNNLITNLEYVSLAENIRHSFNTGLHTTKTKCPSGHTYSEDNT